MFLDHGKEMGIDERFPSKHRDKINPHLLTFPENPLDKFVGEFRFSAVSQGIAPFAAQVAMEGGGKDHDEGWPEAVFFFKLRPFSVPLKKSLKK
jgi:hypothetical protein